MNIQYGCSNRIFVVILTTSIMTIKSNLKHEVFFATFCQKFEEGS